VHQLQPHLIHGSLGPRVSAACSVGSAVLQGSPVFSECSRHSGHAATQTTEHATYVAIVTDYARRLCLGYALIPWCLEVGVAGGGGG